MSSSFDNIGEIVADNTSERVMDIMEEFNEMNDINEFESIKEAEKTPTKKIKKTSHCSGTRKKGKPPLPHNVSGKDSYIGKRKNQSPFWDHFDKTDDLDYARCKYCDNLIGCSSKNGTSLANHIRRCKKLPANIDLNQKKLDLHTQTIVTQDGVT